MLITKTATNYQIKQGDTLYSCSLDFQQFKQEAKIGDNYRLSGRVVRPPKAIIFFIQNQIKKI